MQSTWLRATDPRWLAFISQQPEATTFHHPAWIELLRECYGYRPKMLVVLDANGALAAGLPLMEVNSLLTGRRLVSLPFSDFCPPLAVSEASSADLLASLQAHRRERKWQQVQVHWPLPEQVGVYPGAVTVRTITGLVPDSGQVFRGFKKSVCQQIHQAEKSGLVVQFSTSWPAMRQFYDMHLQTRRRLGVPVQPLRFFRLLWQRLVAADLGFVITAYRGDTAIAGAVYLFWQRVLTCKYAASLSEYWHLRPNNLLFWRAMRWGCENDYQIFDWGKSDLEDEGLRSFKRGWAGVESLIHYSVLTDQAPQPQAPGKSQRYLASLIQRSPVWVCRAIGEVLYQHFA